MDHSQNGPVEPGTTVFERDFLDVLRALYRRRWLVIGGVLAAAVLSLLASMFTAKTYRSTGFFQLSDPYQSRISSVFSVASRFLESSQFLVLSQLKEAELLPVLEVLKDKELPFGEAPNPYILTIQDFKKFFSRYRSAHDFLMFAERNGELAEGELGQLRVAAGQLPRWISGVYALSRDEMKDIWRSLENQRNFVSGVNVRFDAPTPDLAKKGLNLLGDYIAFATLQERVRDYVAANLSEFTLLAGRYGTDILRYRQLIGQLEKQKTDLLELKRKYPGRTAAQSQLMSLEGNGRRYLSVEAQIIGLESRIIDLQAMIDTFAAEKKKAELYLDYFTQCKGLQLNGAVNGPSLLSTLETFSEEFFKAHETIPGAPDVRNSLTTDLKRFAVLHEQSLRFVSGPTAPSAPVGPRKSVYLLFGLFLGCLIFVALALFLEFWKRHKDYIIKKD